MAKAGLGRGLESLIPQKVNRTAASTAGDAVVDVTTDADRSKILQINPNEINVNPMQPRKKFVDSHIDELVGSISEHGIIQPLIVTEKDGVYELIAGERRLRASKKLGLEAVPVIIRDTDEQGKLELALIENLQRENLNPIETALAYRKLIDEFSLTQEDVSKRVGKSRPVVTNGLRLLNLPEEIQDALVEGKISEGHAKLISGLDSEEKQINLLKKIMHKSLSVQASIQESRRMGGTKAARIKINYADKDKEFALREFFGTKVNVKRSGKGGKIIIEFFSDDELHDIVNKVKNNK